MASDKSCERIQENLAWMSELDGTTQKHVLSCEQCGKVAEEMTRLSSLFSMEHSPEAVPDGFAESVMAQISRSHEQLALLNHLPAQLAAAAVAVAIAIAELIGFIFFLVTPTGV